MIDAMGLPEEVATRSRDLVFKFVREISEIVGEPRQLVPNVEVMLLNDGPGLQIIDSRYAVVYVGPNAMKYEPTLVANLAHESVHLHEGTTGYASGLEEGFAVDFELSKIEEFFGGAEKGHFIDHLPIAYRRAYADYRHLVSLSRSAARDLRAASRGLSSISATEVRKRFPTIGLFRSWRLSRRKRMR